MNFTIDSLIKAGGTFLFLFGELFLLFIVISFVVALLQIYVSKQKIQRILTTPRKTLNSILGAALGAVTPFCSCSTIPILVGLIKSGAPFSGMMSFLLTSPILNPAIIALFLTFFGVQATLLYTGFTFVFAVVAGLVLDKMGFEKEMKKVSVKGGNTDDVTWESLQGTLSQRHIQAMKFAFKDAFGLFRGVLLFLLLGAGIGAFIYEFIPTDLLGRFAGANNLWAVPLAALVGVPMYIRTETMIPIASILIGKGVGSGTMIALIIGGAGASIPEVSLLSSIFKKKMVIAFLVCIMLVATTTGYLFNILL
jgi:uncharacterized membrane protein YraQ (UPF0718 family)